MEALLTVLLFLTEADWADLLAFSMVALMTVAMVLAQAVLVVGILSPSVGEEEEEDTAKVPAKALAKTAFPLTTRHRVIHCVPVIALLAKAHIHFLLVN